MAKYCGLAKEIRTLNEEIRVLGIRKEPYQHVRVYGKMG